MDQNMDSFTLDLQNLLIAQQLERTWGELRTASVDEYGIVISDTSTDVPKVYNFVDMDANVIPELSFGKRDKIHLIFLLQTFVDVLISRRCGNQRVDDIMRKYLVVVQVFVSYFAIRSLESSLSEYLITQEHVL